MHFGPNIQKYQYEFGYANQRQIPTRLMTPFGSKIPISKYSPQYHFIQMNQKEVKMIPPNSREPQHYYFQPNYQMQEINKNQYMYFQPPNPYFTPLKPLAEENKQEGIHPYFTGQKERNKTPVPRMYENQVIPIQPYIKKEKSEKNQFLLDSNNLSNKKTNTATSSILKSNIKNDYEFEEIKQRTFHGPLISAIRKSDGQKVDIQQIMKHHVKNFNFNFNSVMERAFQNLPQYINPPIKHLQKIYELYEDKNNIYICCESIEEIPLSSFIEENLTELEISYLIKNLLQIINYLYKNKNKNKLTFPNLNLYNIRVKKTTDEIKIKIGNNGLFLFDEYIIPNENFLYEIAFYSPQRAKLNERTLNSDIWAIGVILVIILIGKLPYPISSCTMIQYRLKSINFKISEKDLESSSWILYSKEAIKFALKCFSQTSIEELLGHPWLSEKLDSKINSIEKEKEINESLKLKKKTLIILFNLHNIMLTYLSTNDRLNKQINYLILLCKNSDSSENGFISSDKIIYFLNQLNLHLTENELSKIIDLHKSAQSFEVDYTITISKIIYLLNKDLEEDLKKSFKFLEQVLSKEFKLTYIKIIIDPNFPYFEEKIRKLTLEFNLFKDSWISLNEFLLIIENNWKAKSTWIKL